MAALAEFRADWATAVKTYQAAYLELLRIPPVGQLPLQRWTELTSVAEVMHLKVTCPSLQLQKSQSMSARTMMALLSWECLPESPDALVCRQCR